MKESYGDQTKVGGDKGGRGKEAKWTYKFTPNRKTCMMLMCNGTYHQLAMVTSLKAYACMR